MSTANYQRVRKWIRNNDFSVNCSTCNRKVKGKKLNIQHIDHDTSNDNLSNFMYLCRKCHCIHHGSLLSEDTRFRMGSYMRGKKRARESVDLTASWHRGKKRSKETCERISKAKKGKKLKFYDYKNMIIEILKDLEEDISNRILVKLFMKKYPDTVNRMKEQSKSPKKIEKIVSQNLRHYKHYFKVAHNRYSIKTGEGTYHSPSRGGFQV